ncbi:MAG: alpha-amylase family glycosyl hydrolase [Planctomycetota bacterium]
MTQVEQERPEALAEAILEPRGEPHASPASWRDQVIYFLLPDRFSNGREGSKPLYQPGRFQAADKARWMAAGRDFQGGTLAGIRDKLSYLRDLGVTTLWLGPIWKQRAEMDTYHGYAIQDFLDVDPRFGTRQELRDLVDAAHAMEMYVVLDVTYNHSGDNWFYKMSGQPQSEVPYRFEPPYPFHGWRTESGESVAEVSEPDDGVWPREFQDPEWYTRAGSIQRWDPAPWEDPMHPNNEFRRGDFYSLKDLLLNELESGSDKVLSALIRVYQYWIALSDCDGFRVDTVKHVSWEASRNFCGAIHEYAESIGKNNFLLLGEVTGGDAIARNYLEIFGRNLDAVLDVGYPAAVLGDFAKGLADPRAFFELFSEHRALGTHRQVGRYHVSVLDDHDMVGRGKRRFSAGNTIAKSAEQVAHAVGVQLTTLGIPCIYYGTEQALDGTVDRHDTSIEPADLGGNVPHADRYVRESMFAGTFGAFQTEGCHFFDAEHPTYARIAAIARIRNSDDKVGLALRRGRQYQRETSFGDRGFGHWGPGQIAAWSRLLVDQEVLLVLNTHGTENRGADVTVDASLHAEGSKMRYLYRGDWSPAELASPPTNQTALVQRMPDGRAAVRVELPPAGFAVLA